jgi:DNA-binding MarR family transcriptional regulator
MSELSLHLLGSDLRYGKMVAAKRQLQVTLTDEELAAARALLEQLIGEDVSSAARLPRLACGIHNIRRERRRFFPDQVFADPAWDMILALYCAEDRGERLSVTSLGYSVGLPQATAARWIGSLRRAGLIEQQQDERDGRRKFLRLSSLAQENVTSWLERAKAVLESGLAASPTTGDAF